ncbi:GntR family transcriptional regulator [Lentzea kentuckyensis]|uniref:GntR family transcriptional regulator n=1 Tax=Lentzea kentuckyensis TaxID=360086 RepID=UPI003CCBD80B
MAGQLQMSKAPVREALAALRRLGWVEVIPRSGYRVAPVTLRDAGPLRTAAVARARGRRTGGQARGTATRRGRGAAGVLPA